MSYDNTPEQINKAPAVQSNEDALLDIIRARNSEIEKLRAYVDELQRQLEGRQEYHDKFVSSMIEEARALEEQQSSI